VIEIFEVFCGELASLTRANDYSLLWASSTQTRQVGQHGEMTPPCGVPQGLALIPPPLPSSTIGARSQALMSFRMRPSLTRRAIRRISSRCGIVSKKAVTYYPPPPGGLSEAGNHHSPASSL
jgi:hypothetical protein